MSQNRNMDRSPDKKPKKRTKYSDVQEEEEEEEKAKDVGKEGNAALSSTPTKTATGTDTEGSDTMNVQPYGDDSKSSSSTDVGESKKGVFAFKMQLTQSDVEGSMLFFPFKLVSDHFPPPAEPIPQMKLKISDIQGFKFDMTLMYSPPECMITHGWNEFVYDHELKAKDVIYFFRPDPRLHGKHYLIRFVRRWQNEDDIKWDQENFLFKLKLTRSDVEDNRLAIPEEEVRNHFPIHEVDTLYYFTDTQNKDWCMKLTFNQDLDDNMIIDGWEGFVNEHNLKAMDVMKFYKPVQPLHPIHFFVVKSEEGGTKQTQTSAVKNIWDDSGYEGDSEKGGSSPSESNNEMEKTGPIQSDPEDDNSCESCG